MEKNIISAFLVLILMFPQNTYATTCTTGFETLYGARHATNETKAAILSVPAVNTQFPPTTVASNKVPGTVGVSQTPFGLFPVRD